ncbi:hypothetical protein [Avibacterium sp. 20-129]|uniref:hypothetical protein n=1 Tax=Avibacterium sp. 20-129 TaxID=2911525 RepID=UPI002246613D|nr:hypothetical protein [Avibacterium sp. 20-129]MCW9699741.1 hypothetical protein [Avibacterium sp. 20-129]
MSELHKSELEAQLNEVIVQLQQAQTALSNNQFTHASIYVGTVQNQLPRVRQKLTNLH